MYGDGGMRLGRAGKAMMIASGALTAAACASYPSEPTYSTRPMPGYGQPGQAPYGGQPGGYDAPAPAYESPPPATAPTVRIDGGALPPAGSSADLNRMPPGATTAPAPTAPHSTSMAAGASYQIQAGDTLSGVGRRFQTPVQALIDLNGLGPRGALTSGQRLILPESAVDTGRDPYATGPSPVGVYVPEAGTPPPPPPPPPSGNAALPTAPRTPTLPAPGVAAPAGAAPAFQWPVRGEVVRRFGPMGMGERNNGIRIGAPAGAEVRAAAAGRVAYVGDLVGQGLVVLVVHTNGWRTAYGHLGSASVRDGDELRAGQQVGTVGLTGGDGRPSIQFETRQMRGDDPVAVDPITVLPR